MPHPHESKADHNRGSRSASDDGGDDDDDDDAAHVVDDGELSEDGEGLFQNGDHGGDGDSAMASDDDGAAAHRNAKRLEKISVKAWLARKQHFTPIVSLLPQLQAFLSGDFDPLDDEEDKGIPLWRRFMDSCAEGEAARFIGSCLAAAHLFIDRRYTALGYHRPTGSDGNNNDSGGAGGQQQQQKQQPKAASGRPVKRIRESDWPTDLGTRLAFFLANKELDFVFENVPVKPSFYEQYSKYGKRSFEKIPEDQLKGDPAEPERPTHMKSRVVFTYAVAQKGKAPKPLKPDEVLTNKLFKRQCQVLWRDLQQKTRDKVHNMVNRALQKRAKARRAPPVAPAVPRGVPAHHMRSRCCWFVWFSRPLPS
jgi:hypothetical protein